MATPNLSTGGSSANIYNTSTGALGYQVPGAAIQSGWSTLPTGQTGTKPDVSSSPTYTPPPAASTATAGGASAPANNYSVVTSAPATANYNAASTYYNNTIQPNMNAAASATKAQQVQANSLPVINGYNVSATPTGNQGETKATNNATGQEYYITPQNQPASANDIIGALSGSNATTGTTAPTGGSNTPATPAQIATQQTGINPTTENANFQDQTKQATDQMTQAYNIFQSTIQQIQSGAFPLSGAQQSLVDATNQAFQQMTTQANLKAAALSSETGGVSNMVNATAGELLNITSQQAATVAKLELGFQQQDYQEVTDSYNEFRDYETQKMDSIQKLHDSVMSTYNNALDAAQKQQSQQLAEAQFQETEFKDAQTLADSRYDFQPIQNEFGQRIGTQAFDKQTGQPVGNPVMNGGQTNPSTGATAPVVTTDPNTGTVDKNSQAAYLATLPKNMQAMVQGIANGKIEPPSARTATGAQILSMVAQYDPTLSNGQGGFDATKYAARLTMQKSLSSYTAGSYGSGLISANKVISHLNSFLTDSSKLPGYPVNPFNINKAVSSAIGGTEALFGNTSTQQSQSTAEQEARGLTDEMTKFFKGTGGTDVGSLESWGSSLNPNAAAGTQKGVVQGTLNLFSGQLNAFINQYQNVMGQKPDIGTIIQPQTLSILEDFKNEGYQIDIPGVGYSDPVAYSKASPDNASELAAVRSAYPNLTPAQALQLAQYNQQ
jgi:hypothetical protein